MERVETDVEFLQRMKREITYSRSVKGNFAVFTTADADHLHSLAEAGRQQQHLQSSRVCETCGRPYLALTAAPPSAPVLPEPIQEHRSTSPSDHLPENAFPRPARRVSVFYGKFREQRGIHSGIALTFNEWMDFAEEWGRSLALYEHQMENKNGL